MADHNRRFARAPSSEHNAHRPVLPGEVLEDIVQLRHQHKLSKSLTSNDGGALYALEPTPAANAAHGSRIDVFESEDGTLSLRSDGVERPANVFEKKAPARRTVRAGTIVPNKHLSAVPELIIAQQERETAAGLDKARSCRERQLLKDRLGHVAAAH